MSVFIGIYKSVYSYQPQSEEELKLGDNDLLYLLEKSDIDDWWKVKKKIDGNDISEPIGLVPSNYIEPADIIDHPVALYDYDKQTEEEISFKEGDVFDLYDSSDPDWYLVGLNQKLFGFIPSNYIQLGSSNEPQSQSANSVVPQQPIFAQPPITASAGANFPPPPQHSSKSATIASSSIPETGVSSKRFSYDDDNRSNDNMNIRSKSNEYPSRGENDKTPPPMPTRPQAGNVSTVSTPSASSIAKYEDLDQDHKFDGEYFVWNINELEGRKKRKVELSIGNGKLIFKRPTIKNKTINEQEWKINNLVSFSSEKKHIFLEFKNPSYEIELHCGSKDVADAILSILGDLKGAQRASGLKEVYKASKPSGTGFKTGKLIYDFDSQSSDELGCKAGDIIYILDDTKSKDWWMCQNVDTGKEGVVPSSYIEVVGSSALDSLTKIPGKKMSTLKKSLSLSRSKRSSYHASDRSERDKIRERDNRERKKHSSSHNKDDKSRPNSHRVRTWIDSSGSFKVEAEFLGCVDGKIHLHKTNGVKIAVGATKLSIEDLEYVEKLTGTSLETYKSQVLAQMQALKNKQQKQKQSATSIINDTSKASSSKISASNYNSSKESDYDWFEFFLNCGVDVSNCQRYSLNFTREQIDETVLSDISPALLRTLGLREGDIIRVTKFLDNKFDRKPVIESYDNSEGGLFTESSGALKNNRSASEIPKIDASSLPQSKSHPPLPNKSYEDDAWAVKPAARSTDDLITKPLPTSQTLSVSKIVQPQFTGSMQDLVNIKPLESNSNNNSSLPSNQASNSAQYSSINDDTKNSVNQAQNFNSHPSAPALQPVKTGSLIQPGQQFQIQKTGNANVVASQPTGGLIPMQPTGFIPIAAQPTGFVPIQPTGGLIPLQTQTTYGIIPLQTGTLTLQKSGGFPSTSFGTLPLQQTGSFIPLQTDIVTIQKPAGEQNPITTFGNSMPNLIPLQKTGNQTIPNTSFGGLSLQPTGNYITLQKTGGNQMPVTSFGTLPTQQTGGFVPLQTGNLTLQKTGGNQPFPATSFGTLPTQQTGGFVPLQTGNLTLQKTGGNQPFPPTSFGSLPAQKTGGFVPQSSFGQSIMPQLTFGQNNNNPINNNNFNDNTSFNNGFNNNSFNQFHPNNSFGLSQTQAQPFMSQQTTFNQQSFMPQQHGQLPMNQLTNMFQNTNLNFNAGNQFNNQFSNGPQQQAFNHSFGQPPQQQQQFSTFNQPLQPQPTGAGFGNAPSLNFGMGESLQSQPTGKRANLNAATPNNPFGF